jgi:hypothetical protein
MHENPIPPLKKEIYQTPTHSPCLRGDLLATVWDRSARPENFRNTAATRFLLRSRNTAKIHAKMAAHLATAHGNDTSATTAHAIPPKNARRGRRKTNTATKHRFRRLKGFGNTAATPLLLRWRNTRRNGGENRASVTTSHLFSPNDRRRVAFSLPSWLRNSDVVGRRYNYKADRGRGGSAARSGQDALIHKLTRNFMANGSPALLCGLKKQRRPTIATATPHVDAGPGSYTVP